MDQFTNDTENNFDKSDNTLDLLPDPLSPASSSQKEIGVTWLKGGGPSPLYFKPGSNSNMASVSQKFHNISINIDINIDIS